MRQDDRSISPPPPPDPPRPEPSRAARHHRYPGAALAAMGAAGLLGGLLLGGWVFQPDPVVKQASDSAARVVQQAENDPSELRYANDQQKAEITLLRAALRNSSEVISHHRHHSQVMWDLLMGKITSREAWWQGGDSTCAGWLAANRAEIDLAKLRGLEAHPPPIPKQGLEFCKQARERR